MERVLVTGATGFIGRMLCETLARSGYQVRVALRKEIPAINGAQEAVVVGDMADADWTSALLGVDRIVHLAGLAHTGGTDPRPYFMTNVSGMAQFTKAAAQAGVRRFVYVSSIKANDETVQWETDPYGMSKRAAERIVTSTHGMEAVVVRPPLVYGPGVRANFLRLMRWVDRGIPLPLGAVRNHRSLVSVWNLCDLLVTCLTHPRAMGTWQVSDGEDLSTPDLIRRLALAIQRPARLIPIPVAGLKLLGTLTGKSGEIERLCGSLTVDSKPIREALGWAPPLTVDEGLKRTVDWYLTTQGKAS